MAITVGNGISIGAGVNVAGPMYTSNMILLLDAGAPASYPGSGTVWYDLSGNSNNFNIVAGAYNSTGVKYMDFNGSYGCAKNGGDIALSDATGVTYCLVTRIKGAGDWRTLTRSYSSDHQVIIYYNGYEIGMYDNDGVGFLGSGYYQTSLPNYGTSNWILLYWRWQSGSPYYQLSYNDTPGTIRGSITNSNARYNRGFGSIGGYHNGVTDPSNASQFWGDIALFAVYNAYLSDEQLMQNYSALKGKYSL